MKQLQYHGFSEYERFLKCFQAGNPKECWNWVRSRKRIRHHGLWYGQWRNAAGKIESSHRAAWRLFKGPIPEGMQILHGCDNPACVNPTHLFVGTASENAKDMWAKGRGGSRGAGNGNAKLTVDLVRDIRSSNERGSIIARRLGISHPTICDIRKRRSWKHIA